MSEHWQGVTAQNVGLEIFYKTAIRNNLSVAIWRLPNTTCKQAIVDLSGRERKVAVDFRELPAGFLVAPFKNGSDSSNTFIRADVVYKNSACLLTGNADHAETSGRVSCGSV